MKSLAQMQSNFPARLGMSLTLLAPAATLADAAVDPGSLTRLHDVIAPPPVPWWPLAGGWYALAALLLATVLLGGWLLWRRRRAGRYRKAALAELETLRNGAAAPSVVATEVMILLKRTALAAYPRPQVAALTGPSWWAFLDQAAGTEFGREHGPLVQDLIYGTAARPAGRDPVLMLCDAAERWIRRHDAAAMRGPVVPRAER